MPARLQTDLRACLRVRAPAHPPDCLPACLLAHLPACVCACLRMCLPPPFLELGVVQGVANQQRSFRVHLIFFLTGSSAHTSTIPGSPLSPVGPTRLGSFSSEPAKSPSRLSTVSPTNRASIRAGMSTPTVRSPFFKTLQDSQRSYFNESRNRSSPSRNRSSSLCTGAWMMGYASVTQNATLGSFVHPCPTPEINWVIRACTHAHVHTHTHTHTRTGAQTLRQNSKGRVTTRRRLCTHARTQRRVLCVGCPREGAEFRFYMVGARCWPLFREGAACRIYMAGCCTSVVRGRVVCTKQGVVCRLHAEGCSLSLNVGWCFVCVVHGTLRV